MQNGKINYSEFLSATICATDINLTKEKMQAVFKQFDVDHSGVITVNNMKDAFCKLGRELS